MFGSGARPGGAPAASTDWTPIQIQPGANEARAAWLKEMAARAPTDATELLADFLPSILGIPDAESLALAGPYLYHADRNVRIFASAGLTYWPAAEAGCRRLRVATNQRSERRDTQVSQEALGWRVRKVDYGMTGRESLALL